jgi:SOS-response transcriptional repressor LexA
MHPIQLRLLQLSRTSNLAEMTLRQMAEGIGAASESPQKIKHHLLQLQRKGLLTVNRSSRTMTRVSSRASVSRDLVSRGSKVFSIPIVGTANCGPATLFAEENFEGVLRVSSKLVGRSAPTGLYALRADGPSMNRAQLSGRTIDDGDYVIVDGDRRSPKKNDVVVVIIDNKATIKRFLDDRANRQVVLIADSSFDYEPVYLHEDDDFRISGKVIAVIKRVRT